MLPFSFQRSSHLLLFSAVMTLVCLSSICCDKFRICTVDGRGAKKASHYCPLLDHADSKVECVIGTDRLDCLRRISKGTADFSVFTPEDLVIAANSEIDVLVTNELRYSTDNNEYEVVAVINDDSGIKSRHDLKDKRLCHPGYGYETDWTRIIANYLEASVVPQYCEQGLTLTENRIKASSDFFKSACKAGPWVNNEILDHQLKSKYRNLCELCDIPEKCTTQDKYWGRQGPLFCLTDGFGDISWTRLDDVEMHFGLTPGYSVTKPDGYSFLCPDDTTIPLNSSRPCVWVVKPWPVIATKRTSAQDIQAIIDQLTRGDVKSWQTALLNLIETYHLSITKMDNVEAIESYFDRATGYLSANSFSGCHPPRTIKICTTSNLENTKCGWLRETAGVYGIEPDLDCIKADNTTHCMQAINDQVADVVMVPPDLIHLAINNYSLKSLFYETVNNDNKYITVAVIKNTSNIRSFHDLKGKRACFPVYDGIAYNSVKHTFHNKSIIKECPRDVSIGEFFGPSCVPNLPEHLPKTLKEICNGNSYDGEYGALHCLTRGKGDVAFVSKNTLLRFLKNPNENSLRLREVDFDIVCAHSNGCHLSWAPVGQAMVHSGKSDLWTKDTLEVFLQLDNLFGKHHKSTTTPFTLFSNFNSEPNVLFSDSTVRFREVPTAKNTDKMPREYNSIYKAVDECQDSGSISVIKSSSVFIVVFLVCVFL